MELYTRIEIPKPPFAFSYEDRILLMGSCFAENIGKKLEECRFPVDINPFGTLYNPVSVAQGLRQLLHPKPFSQEVLFERDGLYHSFSHHSRFSAESPVTCLRQINERLASSAAFLREASRLIITWGTAFVYRLRADGQVVANCHKLPERLFERSRLSVEEIVADWKALLPTLWKEANPELKVLFTVSPIRHWKDGARQNQISKATLLLATEELERTFPGQVAYFPAYELMMDELRDYRFYADDMLHPSGQAVGYIWERFQERCLTPETAAIRREWTEIQKAIQHKPFRPDSEAYQRFIFQTLLKMERLNEKFPFFELQKEIEWVKSKLK